MPNCFSYSYYENLLEQFLNAGYHMSLFTENSYPGKLLYLRHDVDCSPEKAMHLAEIEAQFGIRATYFYRVHSHLYNCFSHKTYLQIKRVKELGHDIGLHTEFYDAARIFEEEGSRVFMREKKILEEIIQKEIMVFSPHRTHGSSLIKAIVGKLDTFKTEHNLVHPYEPRFFTETKYLSDSRGIWPEGEPTQHINVYPKIQLLIHPVWWYRQNMELEDYIL